MMANSQQTLFELDKECIQNYTADVLNSEKPAAFPLRSGTKQGCSLSYYISTPYWKS